MRETLGDSQLVVRCRQHAREPAERALERGQRLAELARDSPVELRLPRTRARLLGGMRSPAQVLGQRVPTGESPLGLSDRGPVPVSIDETVRFRSRRFL